jgi:SAM-dependent methyltransferase
VSTTPQTADAPATRCVWCDAPLAVDIPRGGGRVRCARCGAATTDPWPSPQTLERAYARYRPAEGRFGGPLDAFLRRSRATLAGRIDKIAPPGPLLDVGAGDGTLIDALAARGRQATGLELASPRPDIRDADITEINETGFAGIVFWHSLEHLPAPGAAIARAAELLAPGGVLVVAVPNTESLQATAFGDRWLALDLPRHLVHLPASALLRRIEDLGLNVTRTSHVRGGQAAFGWVHGLVGSLPGTPDLYDAIRRPEARTEPVTPGRRAYGLGAAALLAPVAVTAAGVEAAVRRGGSIYFEARRPMSAAAESI